MADITKCNGENCVLRDGCYRFTAPTSMVGQVYFCSTPIDYTIIKKGKCDHLWVTK